MFGKFLTFCVTARQIWLSTTVKGRYERQKFLGACPTSNRIDGKTPNPFFLLAPTTDKRQSMKFTTAKPFASRRITWTSQPGRQQTWIHYE
jgi:hypothetical protein